MIILIAAAAVVFLIIAIPFIIALITGTLFVVATDGLKPPSEPSQANVPEEPAPVHQRAKVKISAKQIIQDIRSGMDNPALMDKYELSPDRLQTIFKKLVEQGRITQSELGQRIALERAVGWRCPNCGEEQPEAVDECPSCGIIVEKFLRRS